MKDKEETNKENKAPDSTSLPDTKKRYNKTKIIRNKKYLYSNDKTP